MGPFRLIELCILVALFAVEVAEKKPIYNGRGIQTCSLMDFKKQGQIVLDASVFGGEASSGKVADINASSSSMDNFLMKLDYLNVTSSADHTLSESYTSFDGCSLFDDDCKKEGEPQSGKNKGRGQSIQEQLSSDLLALGLQAVLKRKYNDIRLSSKFSFEEMTKCLFEDKQNSREEGIISNNEWDYNKSFVECCSSYIPDVLGKETLRLLNGEPGKYISSFCTDLKLVLEEVGIAFRIPFKWLPSASEKLSFLSKLKISGSKNLVNNKKYCHLPRKTLDIVFDVDLTLLTMVPVLEVTPGEKSIMLEMLEVPQEIKAEAEAKNFKFNTRRSSDNTLRYNIPHEVHLNPQTIGLLFSLYYRRFLDPCVGSLSILSAGFNTILKFATSMYIEPIMSPSRFHLSDTLLELFPDDNESSWATERPALLAFKENRISSVQIPPLNAGNPDTSSEDNSQTLIRSFPGGFPELVYNGLPFLVKDMQRYRLHSTLQKGSSSYDYMLLSEELNPIFLNTLRLYQTMKRYPILTHPFNNPNLFSNNRPLSLLVDDELLHFTYACSMEAWSDNILIAWTEKLGPRETKIPFSRYYLPIPLQHIHPKPIKMGEFSRDLNVMMNLDYFEGLTYQISQLKSLNSTGKSHLGKKHSKAMEELKDMEQFLSSASENELDWSGNLNFQRDGLFSINTTDSTSSITPSKLLTLVYPDEENSKNMFSCPYDIANIKLFYIVLIVPCETLYMIYRKLKDLGHNKRDPFYRLVKIIDMFIVTNERKEEICDRFISSLSGVIAFRNEESLLNRRVIYPSVSSLAALKSVIGLPIYRTITLWLQSSDFLDESQVLRENMKREVNLMEDRLKDTAYEPLANPRQLQNGIIYDRSVHDIESLIILEPIKGKFIREVPKFNTTQELEDIMGLFSLFSTVRSSLELGYRDVKKRVRLENPTSLTSQSVISVLIYSMCYGLAVEQFSKFHLNVCNLPRPVFSRPVLRRNQQEWMRFAITQVLTELSIKLSFPITRSFERRLGAFIHVSNPKSSQFNTLFQPYFSGTPYRPVKSKVEHDNKSLNSTDTSNNHASIKSGRDSHEVYRKNLVILHDDLLEYLINSLSSLDYMPFFVRQCISVTTVFVKFQIQKSEQEPSKNGQQKSSSNNDHLAVVVCHAIQEYLQKKVPQFFKL